MSDAVEGPSVEGVVPVVNAEHVAGQLGVQVDPTTTNHLAFQTDDTLTVEVPRGDDITATLTSVQIEHGLILWLDTDRDLNHVADAGGDGHE